VSDKRTTKSNNQCKLVTNFVSPIVTFHNASYFQEMVTRWGNCHQTWLWHFSGSLVQWPFIVNVMDGGDAVYEQIAQVYTSRCDVYHIRDVSFVCVCCLSVSLCSSVYVSQSMFLSLCSPVYVSQSMFLSVCLSIYAFLCMFFCLSLLFYLFRFL
jgi:hypothetical protein